MDIKKEKAKMKAYFIFFIVFAVLAGLGLLYILINGGEPNAGYTMVPLVIGAIFYSLYQEAKKTIDSQEG